MGEEGDAEKEKEPQDEKRWCVVGGFDKGGILVRTGRETSSPAADKRLACGALVREVEVADTRLCYKKISGEGPENGWVAIRLPDKILMERAPVWEPKEASLGREAGVYVERPPVAPASRKIRVLCLHGTASAEKVLRQQLAMLVMKTKDDIEWIVEEGSIVCEESNKLVAEQVKIMRPHFPDVTFKQYAEPLGEQLGWRRYEKLEEVTVKIQAALKKQEPIDAVLGFSQGSNIAHVIAAQSVLGKGAPLRCVVHLCSNKPGWVGQMPELFGYKIPLPALVVRAEKDTVSTGFEEVASSYDSPERGSHSGEHRPLPAGKEAAELALKIKDFILRHCREDK
eukprot:gnl/TRDRNA2_/TRDRNA2_171634_c0_seq2.p1 gnl/TRDRNA2_/TRDRNA2_171634_c0~~gnl/TRDRNA2_/TRDRNA2_171634_c0_seq2.p1  ORF type:complete len:352 (+),score=81.47 gnl/TRDRNA2_/TRDRNA2_171634_c0_seq2:38-1057(+)